MAKTRNFSVVDAETKQVLGILVLDKAALPGELVTKFRRDELMIESLPDTPPFTRGKGGVHDERRKGKQPA